MTWMQTLTGEVFDLQALANGGDPGPTLIQDIAGSLAKLCRFNGHTTRFYSVAEHSILVSIEFRGRFAGPPVTPASILAALLHDAHEAYIGDTIRPMKQLGVKAPIAEERLDQLIFERLGVPFPDLETRNRIKEADLAVLTAERRDLMGPCDREWAMNVMPCHVKCFGADPEAAERSFLGEFNYWKGLL